MDSTVKLRYTKHPAMTSATYPISINITTPHPGLMACEVFGDTANCQKCGHYWQDHKRILNEISKTVVMVKDPGIEAALKRNVNDITLRQNLCSSRMRLIEEYTEELNVIRKTSAKFAIFLQRDSITPYNDATQEYIGFQIKEEKEKIQAGGKMKRLEALLRDKHAHEHEIEALNNGLRLGGIEAECDLSENGIDALVKQLYELKHFGCNLQELRLGFEVTDQGTTRERPSTLHRKRAQTSTGKRRNQASSEVKKRIFSSKGEQGGA